ncbi:predicted protein [Naegleria gruberi]|uniref:Predicted protein n=1 Tax=Naegleria gruberi TaxID=5762 RepID=D2VNA2_NAEGR|nr:uncharacterized protein NAEGRDRAFT_50954 [Naegleria gruberi]EFC41706.1 predicted protein [Naegleria gruberi]|eukprot:XP_002674450.1 predicted protein [Naegleria gruberi strain NEG-M]
MACKLELVYCKNKQMTNLLNRFWRMAIKQIFNLDDQWMKDYQNFIDEHFKGNMKSLFAGLCHANNSLLKKAVKEKRASYRPILSSIVASIMTYYDCGLISDDGCEKHKIVSMIEGSSTPSTNPDSDIVDTRTEVCVDFFMTFSIKEIKVNTLKDYLNADPPQTPKFKSALSICRSDNEESFQYMINGLKYCLELKKTYKFPCLVILNSLGSGPHLVSQERIEQSLKDIGFSFYKVFNLTSEPSPTMLPFHSEFTQEACLNDVCVKREDLMEALERSVKKKCLIQ